MDDMAGCRRTPSSRRKSHTGRDAKEDRLSREKFILHRARHLKCSIQERIRRVRLAKAYVEKYEGRLSRGHSYQEAWARYWHRVKRETSNFVAFFVPWEMRIKRIESHFGSVVSSYFTFLRWMFWVNIILTIMTTAFIVLPEIFIGPPMGSIPRKSVPEGEKERALNMETVIDFGGYIQYSVLFYGYYGDDQTIGQGYRLPLAYFLVGLGTYGISFVIILRKMARNSRLLNTSSQDDQYTFSWKLFTTWDYMIGNSETTKNKAAEIATNFRESISEEQEKVKKKNKKTLLALRVLANFLVCIVLASSTYAIYLLVQRSKDVEKRVERGEKVDWFTQNEVSLAMSLITAVFPSIFDLIGLMEKYHPRVNLRWQLARILVLYFMNLYTLIIALYGKILDLIDAAKNTTMPCNQTLMMTYLPHTPVYNLSEVFTVGTVEEIVEANCTVSPGGTALCWETMIGQEIAKLAFFDTVMTVGMVILIDFIRGLCVRYCNRCCCWDLEKKFPEYGEFKIAENLLHLIYNQATVWMGAFFSPMLPALNLVKLLIMLYIRSWAVLVCNIPHERVFKASKSNNFYYALTLLMLFLTTLMVGFLLVALEPSRECGPFTRYERSYQVFTATLTEELPTWATPIMDYIVSPGVIIPLFLLLFMAIYYLASMTRSLNEANKDLRAQLIYERTEEKRKIYAMAGGKTKDDSNVNAPTSILEKERARMAASKEGSKPPIKVVRMPNITPERAQLLKSKNPNLKILTTKEAERLHILPPPSEEQPQQHQRQQNHPAQSLPRPANQHTPRPLSQPPEEQCLEVRRLPALRPMNPTPVAVVQGNSLSSKVTDGTHQPYHARRIKDMV